MGYIISIGFSLLLLLTGCASQNDPQVQAQRKKTLSQKKTAAQEIASFRSMPKRKRAPVRKAPPKYQKIPALNKKRVTFSAEEANLRQVLYSIIGGTGLNLVINKDVDSDIPVTISVTEAPAQDVLNTIMSMSGYHYTLQGNILHVKSFIQKMFVIPYIQSVTSMKTELGGDMLNSTQSGGASGGSGQGIKGDFSLKFDKPQKMNSFYEQLENNLKVLVSPEGRYTLNRSSGVLSIYDKKDRVDVIESMIHKIKKRSQRQVLIEAKILEVVLNDDHNLGVSWEAVLDKVLRSGDQLVLQQTLGLGGAVAGTMAYTTKNFNAVITALNESGDIDMLSNPRIKVLSGQSAMISSGKLVPFWEKEVQTTQGTGGSASTSEVTYKRRDVLNGITMGVTPIIMEDGRIMLNVVPITSNIEKVVEHFDETGKSVASAPVLNIKEAGTVIYANDNDLVSIGGLINNTVSKKQEKLPGLGDLPGLGQLFTKTINKNEKRELVILMKLTVVE